MVSFEQGKIMFIMDLHLSLRFVGKHKDYWANCISFMEQLDAQVEEIAPSAIILGGDIVGVNQDDYNLPDRMALVWLYNILVKWNRITGNNVYLVYGNHDRGARMTDAEMFVSMGLLRLESHIDCGGTRVHMVHFGDEKRELDYGSTDVCDSHIVVAHNTFVTEGCLEYLRFKGAVELSSQLHWDKVDVVIAAHVHTPSSYLSAYIGGHEVNLIYPGCGTRPKRERFGTGTWDTIFQLVLTASRENGSDSDSGLVTTSLTTEPLSLTPWVDLFVPDATDSTDEQLDESGVLNTETLIEIMSTLAKYSLPTVESYTDQIRALAGVDTQAADVAIKFLTEANETLK